MGLNVVDLIQCCLIHSLLNFQIILCCSQLSHKATKLHVLLCSVVTYSYFMPISYFTILLGTCTEGDACRPGSHNLPYTYKHTEHRYVFSPAVTWTPGKCNLGMCHGSHTKLGWNIHLHSDIIKYQWLLVIKGELFTSYFTIILGTV